MEFHNNLNAFIKLQLKTGEDIIDNVVDDLCELFEQTLKSEELKKTMKKKYLDTSYTKVKPKKDPNRIKRPKTSFFFFCDANRQKVVSENPEKNVGEIAKILGKMWRELSPKDKKPFIQLNEKDIERYEDQKTSYDSREFHVKEEFE
uniref:HMG box domain-containing protein n=1 Tax=viral metagenome TaxID=1070528 RepID=A0A6C0F6C3_9ZZZZ|tara:strand:- start:159 stop:599 length:441 start_codon:yes stop_codon:yes gene_type:complete